VVTHDHLDHLDEQSLPGLAEASPDARFIVPEPLVERVAGLGIPAGRVAGARPDRALELDGLTVHPVPASHGDDVEEGYGFGLERSNGLYRYLGYVFDLGGVRVYHAGDTIPYEGMEERLRELRVDVALLPINGRDAEREGQGIVGNLDEEEAAQLAAAIGADLLVPMHYDLFASNPGSPERLVELARTKHPELQVLVASRARRFVYTNPAPK
jgi:L-ascorbate 6-phosphate lactonase